MTYRNSLSVMASVDNTHLRVTIRKCWSYKRLSYEMSRDCQKSLTTEYREHVDILNAITQGDAKKAYETMDDHLKKAAIFREASKIV